MAVPTFLASTHRYIAPTGITASSELTSNLRTELVTNGNWTESPANTFTSPTDADGRFFQIVVSEPTSVRWQWSVYDDLATLVCTREVLLSGAGETVYFHTGDYHLWVEVDKSPNSEALRACLLDLTPEAQDAHTAYVIGNGHRNSSGTSDGAGNTASEWYGKDNGTYATLRRLISYRNNAATEVRVQTLGGNDRFLPAEVSGLNNLSQLVYFGRCFQMFTVNGTNATVTVPIGTAGETASFRRTGLAVDGIHNLAIRAD